MAKREVKANPAPSKDVFAVVGNGASLTRDDLQMLNRKGVSTIVVNDVWEWAPWAWALYSPDYRWWERRIHAVRASGFQGRLFAIDEGAVASYNLEHVYCEDIQMPLAGLSPHKCAIRNGYSGGFQAMQIARAFGAQTIILLGFDYGATGQERAVSAAFPDSWSDFAVMRNSFTLAKPQLDAEGIRVINATRASSLNMFEPMPLGEALSQVGTVKVPAYHSGE